MAFQYQTVAALAPLMSEAFGVSLADIGLLIGLYLAPGVVIAIPGGGLAARYGDRRIVGLSMVLMLIGGSLMTFGGDWSWLVAGRVLSGIGGVALNVVMTKMAADWFAGREISTAMAIFVNSWPVGIGAALVVLPLAAASATLTVAGTVVLAAVGVGLVLFLASYRPAPASGPTAGRAKVPVRGRLPLLALLLAASIWALYNAGLAMVFSFGPTFLTERGWTLTEAGSTVAVFLFLAALTIPAGGVIADRSGRQDLVIWFSCGAFALLLLAALAVPGGAVMPVIYGMGLVAGLAAGPIVGLPALFLTAEVRALGMGIFFAVYYGANLVTPILAGWAADQTGGAGIVFVLGAVMVALCIPALEALRVIGALRPDQV